MVASAAGGLVAIYWFDLGVVGFFAAVAAGFFVYAALLIHAAALEVRSASDWRVLPARQVCLSQGAYLRHPFMHIWYSVLQVFAG